MWRSPNSAGRFSPSPIPAVCGSVLFAALFLATTQAAAQQDSPSVWITSGEVGVGPVDEDVFLDVTPRLTYLRPVPLLFEEQEETLFEASLHVPLRLRIIDREPTDDEVLRREDWAEIPDYFRIIRRVEYGTPRDPIHLRAGELGPARLGHGTIVDDYYNVITTDHYALGLTGKITRPRWSTELLHSGLAGPAVLGARAEARPPVLYEAESPWQRIGLGATVAGDFRAPTALVDGDGGHPAVAGNDLRPLVDDQQPTAVTGVDARWELPHGDRWNITPYTDFNHHFGLGSGLHTGVFFDRDITDWMQISTRFEHRLLLGQYVPVYFDAVYELTRFQHPGYAPETTPAPKRTAADDIDPGVEHGAKGQLQTRIADMVTLAAAFSDATGQTGSDLRLRASIETEDHARIGVFFYQFAPGDHTFAESLAELARIDGSLTAIEGRFTIWGPLYAQGQLARKWRLGDDGRFDNVHLWNVGLGAGVQF